MLARLCLACTSYVWPSRQGHRHCCYHCYIIIISIINSQACSAIHSRLDVCVGGHTLMCPSSSCEIVDSLLCHFCSLSLENIRLAVQPICMQHSVEALALLAISSDLNVLNSTVCVQLASHVIISLVFCRGESVNCERKVSCMLEVESVEVRMVLALVLR